MAHGRAERINVSKMSFSEFEVAATVLALKKETKTSHEANDSRT